MTTTEQPSRPRREQPLTAGASTEVEDRPDDRPNDVDLPGSAGTPDFLQHDEVADRRSLLARALADLRSYASLRGTQYGLAPVVVLGSITFFQRLDSTAFSIAAPFIAQELEINILQLIGILQVVGVFSILAALGAGWYADRHPRVPFVAIGTFFSGLFSMATGQMRTAFTLGTTLVGDQVADEASAVPRFSLIADYYPPQTRGRVFALLGMFRNAATLIAPLVAGTLIFTLGFRVSYLFLGAPLVVLGVVAAIVLREPVRGYMERRSLGVDEEHSTVEDEPLSFAEGWRTVFAIRTVRRLFAARVIGDAPLIVTGLFVVLFLREEYNLNAFQIGMAFTPAAAASLAGSAYGGAIIDRLLGRNPGRVLTVVGLFAIPSSIGLALFALRPPLLAIVVLQAMIGFGASLTGPALGAIYSQVIPPRVRTQGLQVLNLTELPGLVIFTPIFGLMQFEYGYETVFLFAAPLVAIGGLVAATAGGFFELDIRASFATAVADREWREAKAAGRAKMLVCRGVEVDYDGVKVLFGVDLDVEEGEIVALLGTNGAGKSTLLRAISGSKEASAGAIVFDGRDITHMPPHEVAGRRVIHMPGGRGVFPGLSVQENLLLGGWLTDDADEVARRLADVYEIFPVLAERADQMASSLSGGEQQQLSLAQSFLADPKLLMIDELSLGLSPVAVGALIEIVREIHRRGVTVIVVEQSVNVALTLADRAVFMEKGEVRFSGPTSELLARPDILRAVYVKGTGALTDGPLRAGTKVGGDAGEVRKVLEVEGLVKRFGGITAVNGASFHLGEGEVLGLIGPNGAGKTTIFDMISGQLRPDEGIIRLDGVDITSMSPEERARRKLVRRFQDARMFPSLTVFETLLVALEQRLEVKSTALNAVAMPRARAAERRLRVRAERLIELLELGQYRDAFVKELSTGLRRIVDLACVLAAEPRVLLLDEPSSGIAQREAEGLVPLLKRIRYETGCSLLIIEHDMPLISAVSDELVALDQGAVVLRGTPEVVLEDERVITSYLGTSEAAVNRSGSLS
ncbi:MAG TPA: MFS transporter [Acidimicrobiales bacterium]|nr:MFS transporter [Acidimicrobiales bacterium]